MRNFLKEQKAAVFILALIGLVYFILRLPNLTLQPIFADEAIYIRWAQIAKAEPTLRFISLQDGKTPLFMWVMSPFLKVFSDPLFAGRFLSVTAGFFSLIGVIFMGWKFFNKRVALWVGLLMAVTPFIVFFDRMALVDSLLSAFSIWSLNLALLLIKYQRIDLAMVLGYALGGGILTKTPGMFSFLTLPVTLISFKWRQKDRDRQLVKTILLFILAAGIGMVIYNILRLGPGFDMLSSRDQDYIHSPLTVLRHPLDPFLPHLRDVMDWLPKLLTVPILLLVIAGIILAFFKKNWIALAILAWVLLPVLAFMAFLQTFTARYILFSVGPLLCLAAWAIDYLLGKITFHTAVKTIIAALLLVILPAVFDFQLLRNPALAPLPKEERQGYLEDWTAGYGLKNIADYLMNEAQNGTVVVGTDGSFGTLPEGLVIYLDRYSHTAPKDKQVVIVPGSSTISADIRQAALNHPTFFIANSHNLGSSDGVKLIDSYPKVQSATIPPGSILLYRVFDE